MRVDEYFQQGVFGEVHMEPKTVTALLSAVDIDDYDAIYGLKDDDFPLSGGVRGAAYAEMAKHKDDLIILSRCIHPGMKHRHHPDYTKPLEVELLCVSCHHQRHKEVRRKWNAMPRVGQRR